MKREVSLDSQGAHSSGGSLENYRSASDIAFRDAVFDDRDDVVDVSVQVDFPADVITYDSDDETMGRKRFSAFRTKKGMPLYSKEDIREQYCITNKQLHVLETAQARKLFGCIPKEDNWKSCHRASLLSSCLRKTKSASDENLAAGVYSSKSKPMAWEPLPPEMQGRSPRAVSQQITSASVILVDNNASDAHQIKPQQQPEQQKPKDLRQSFDEELANAVLRRKAKLTGGSSDAGDPIQKRHTWAVDDDVIVSERPTLLRLRSNDSGTSNTSDAVSIDDSRDDGCNKRYPLTMPNTPDLSHSVAHRHHHQINKTTPEMTLDERRQKHVSFDCAALVRSHPTISDALTSPPMQRRLNSNSTAVSPDRHRSQERLLDVGTQKLSEYFSYQQQHQHRLGRRLGSVRSLDFMSGWSPKVHPATVLIAKVPNKPMKTQATQTDVPSTNVPDKVSIPAPVLAYLTLSPRAHAVQESPVPIASQSRTFQNGKRLVKSRSDSEYKLLDDSDLRMTVIHLDDSSLVASRKRAAIRTRSSPLSGRRKSEKEIMVVFKPQDVQNNDHNSQHHHPHHHKLLKTCSEGSVLNRDQPLTAIPIIEDGGDDGDVLRKREPPRRERSESDPFLLETTLNEISGNGNNQDIIEERQRSMSEGPGSGAQTDIEKPEAISTPISVKNKRGRVLPEKTSFSDTSRESEESGNHEYQTLTDQSTSGSATSSSRSSASREIVGFDRSSSEREQSCPEGGDGNDIIAEELDSGSNISSCDVDKTISYSSDNEFASIKSEDSHTLVVDQRPSASSPSPANYDHNEKVKTSEMSGDVSKLKFVIKDRLTSPESESSSSKIRSKTDSTKSETSDDYQTATEHSHAETRRDLMTRNFGDNDLTPLTLVPPPVTSVATFVLEESPEFTAEEVSMVTVQETMMQNLPSPRSPHASTMSIESSTSGSYTLEGSDPNLRKLSSGTVSDSDKELENIFTSQSDVFFGSDGDFGEQRDGSRAPIIGEGVEENDICSIITPIPEVVTIVPENAIVALQNINPDDSCTEKDKTEEANIETSTETVTAAASEVVESGYNFKEIRSRFERMLGESSSGDGRVRSSSVETKVETTEGISSGDFKPPIKKKPILLAAKAVGLMGSRSTILEKEPTSKTPMIETVKHSDKRTKEHRRSVSESPETSLGNRSSMDVDGGGAKSKREIIECGNEDRHRTGKKHKSRSQDKSTSHNKHRLAMPIDCNVRCRTPPPDTRSVSESPDRWSPRCSHSSRFQEGNIDMEEDERNPWKSSVTSPRSVTGTISCTFDDLTGNEEFRLVKRCDRSSLPGSTERLEDRRRSHSGCETVLATSLPDRQIELYEVSKMLCTECGEKIRRIHVHEHHESDRLSHDELHYSMTSPETSLGLASSHLGGVPKYNVKVKSTPEGLAGGDSSMISGDPHSRSKSVSGHDSSTESLLIRRSHGSATSAGGGVFDSQGALDNSSGTSSSWVADTGSNHDITHEEEDEDVGIYAESYRASAWVYIGENEELIVWKGKPEDSATKNEADCKSLSSVASAPAALSMVSVAHNPCVDPSSMHRTDSLESTASEKEFRRRYQAITHRMIHRKSSVEMYKRLSNRTFECDKTVMVLRKSGEFGFRIHGSRPVVVSAIEPGTPAETSGLEVGDIVIAVNGVNVLDASHSEVVKIAHTGSEILHLDVARTCHILTPVVSDVESQRPVHSGFLQKLTGGGGGGGGVGLMRKWCRRWFILKRDHCLYYYKLETSKEPLGAIMLLNYTVSRAIEVGRPHAFRVSKYGAASYCFAADDEESMNTWANLINEASNSASQTDPWIEVSSRNVQLPALSIHNPDCHGYLAKLGQRWKSWKRRYCVLKDACIYYYHDVNSVTSLGVAHLHGYRVQSCSMAGKKHAFEIIPPELKMRHLYFYADNDTDRKRWLAALEYSIDRWIKVG